jgi:hypothetical protein
MIFPAKTVRATYPGHLVVLDHRNHNRERARILKLLHSPATLSPTFRLGEPPSLTPTSCEMLLLVCPVNAAMNLRVP